MFIQRDMNIFLAAGSIYRERERTQHSTATASPAFTGKPANTSDAYGNQNKDKGREGTETRLHVLWGYMYKKRGESH